MAPEFTQKEDITVTLCKHREYMVGCFVKCSLAQSIWLGTLSLQQNTLLSDNDLRICVDIFNLREVRKKVGADSQLFEQWMVPVLEVHE